MCFIFATRFDLVYSQNNSTHTQKNKNLFTAQEFVELKTYE